MNFNYTIEFPLTSNARDEIEKIFNIEFEYNGDFFYTYLYDNIDDKENANKYCIRIFDLFWYSELVDDNDPESSGVLIFDELNILFIKTIMTKICDIVKKYKPFEDYKIDDCIICNNKTKQTMSLVGYF